MLAEGIKSVSIASDQQEPQTKIGVVDIYTQNASFVSTTVNVHGPINTRNFNDSNANYNFRDGILCNAFIAHCNIPSKILKFNATNLVMHLLSSLDSPLPDNQWENHYSDSGFTRYSNGYYVYTLGHILI